METKGDNREINGDKKKKNREINGDKGQMFCLV